VSPHRRQDAREAWARIERVLRPAPERTPSACPAYGHCGGCVMQHLAYRAQVAWKSARVAAALGPGARERMQPAVASPRPLAYRNQAKYVYGRRDGRAVLGAYAPRSHVLVDLAGCRVVEPPLDEVAGILRGLLETAAVEPFDEHRRTGLLRYVVMRRNAEGAVLVTLVTGQGSWPGGAALAAALRAAAPAVVGVVQNVNDSGGNVLFGNDSVVLAGRDSLAELVSGVRVQLGPRAFLQLNREVAALAYGQIRAAVAGLGRLGRVVDVFAGVGAVAFALADLADEIIAIEQNPTATAAGARAAADAGVSNVRFVTADAAAGLAAISGADLVVLNPPRAGVGPAACAAVLALRPRAIAYLSCNPVSLARDLATLSAGGLELQSIIPLDMLPHTTHVETLTFLQSDLQVTSTFRALS
jgi:23S rRNA (uracil-5-)-methyltransferase RumA